MKTAIILHGMPDKDGYFNPAGDSESNSHWLPWLQRRLLLKGVLAQTPELPKPYEPDYESWKAVFERFDVNEETILVGHSCGAGFLARWLSEHKVRVGKVALVAPWIDPKPHTLANGFFEFELDPEAQERIESISIFVSSDDDKDIHASVEMLAAAWPAAEVVRFADKGHFTLGDMGTREFPELEQVLVSSRPD